MLTYDEMYRTLFIIALDTANDWLLNFLNEWFDLDTAHKIKPTKAKARQLEIMSRNLFKLYHSQGRLTKES